MSLISSSVFDIKGKRRKISCAKHSLTVEITKRNEASMYSPRWGAWTRATGLRMISSRETNQSIAFFNPPGMACTYSGDETTRPSASAINSQSFITSSGVFAFSRSGLKIGSVCNPENNSTLIPKGACVLNAFSNAVLLEPDRELPEIASIFKFLLKMKFSAIYDRCFKVRSGSFTKAHGQRPVWAESRLIRSCDSDPARGQENLRLLAPC